MVAQRLMRRKWASRVEAQEKNKSPGGGRRWGGEDEVMYRPETKTPAQGRGGFFVVFAKSRKLSLIGAQCQPVH